MEESVFFRETLDEYLRTKWVRLYAAGHTQACQAEGFLQNQGSLNFGYTGLKPEPLVHHTEGS